METMITKPLYEIYRENFRKMEEEYNKPNLEKALEYENSIKDLLRCFSHPVVIDDIMFEMHESKCTQMGWHYNRRTTLNGLWLQAQKDEEEDE